jgi:hypothetical protein
LTGTSTPLASVCARGDNELWAVGQSGTILRFAGMGSGEFRTLLGGKD